jgi:hypothetical protein
MELLGAVLVCGLATWRLASLLHTEDAFEWLRKWIGITNDEKGYPVEYPDGLWGDMFNCFWCLSLAAAVPLSLVIVLAGRMDAIWMLFIWLGSSAFAIWLEKQILRTQSR